MEFHELVDFTELDDPPQLTLRRARTLAIAVGGAADYTLLKLLARGTVGAGRIEVLVVDVECDGVPSRNAAGICYRERLALCVREDESTQVEVLALRKSFPVLMHQNNGARRGPASLCLYYEPIKVVLRTWTPQRMLRRIQWWLEKSAKGELHAADQPVEQLFFVSKYELVLPWNLAQLRADPSQRAVVQRGPQRSDGETCFLHFIPKADNPPKGTVTHIELTL